MLIDNKIRKAALLLSGAAFLMCAGACSKLSSNDAEKNLSEIVCNVTGIATKGSTISTDGSALHSTTTTAITASGFTISAYLEEDGSLDEGWYFQNKSVSYASSKWSIADTPQWLDDVDITFWCWDNYTESIKAASAAAGKVVISDYDTTREDDQYCLKFGYTLPASTAASTKADATNQHDLIFAFNKESRTYDANGDITAKTSSNTAYTRTDNEIDINFRHALAEVLFAVSPDDGTFDPEVEIVDIAIENVCTAGSCVFDDSESEAEDKFTWTPTGSAKYAQACNTDFSAFVDGTNEPDTFGITGNTWQKGTFTKDETTYCLYSTNNKFFMIPQTLGSTAKVTVTFEKDETQTTLSAAINGDVWKAGYYYKYKINYSGSGEFITFSVNLVDWNEVNVELEF